MTEQQAALVRRDDDGSGVCTLTLSRPDVLNALSPSLFRELDEELAALETDTDVACVLLRGAGRSFSAGNDLTAIRDGDTAPYRLYQADIIDRLERLPHPVVAVVHGHCYTGALELALAADFIVCAESAKFADTHARWGLVPSWGMGQRLSRRVGAPMARYLMYTGTVLQGREAQRIGLVVDCVPDEELEARVAALAESMVQGSAHTLRAEKRFVAQSEQLGLRDALAYERQTHPGPAPDMRERLQRGWS